MSSGSAPTLLLLHGYTQHGAAFRADLGPILDQLPETRVLSPDAPFACDPGDLARLGPALGARPERAPHLTWWRSTDDGAVYEGWELARDRLRALLDGVGPVGLLGFSQGSMLGACVAAWSEAGELPPLAFAVLVAGRIPRARALRPLFEAPLATPSLHVWGARDPMAPLAEELAGRFVDGGRLSWAGPHVVPTRGQAARSILDFLQARGAR